MQYRLSLVCQECGFDPLVYMRSHDKACELVKAHLAKRKEDPLTLLKPNPKLDLPAVKKKPQKAQRLDVRL